MHQCIAPYQIKPTFWSLGLRLKFSTLRLKLTLSPECIIAVSQYNKNVTNYIFQNTRLMQIGQQSTSFLGESNNAPPPDSTPNETQSLLMKEFCWHCQLQWFLFFHFVCYFWLESYNRAQGLVWFSYVYVTANCPYGIKISILCQH